MSEVRKPVPKEIMEQGNLGILQAIMRWQDTQDSVPNLSPEGNGFVPQNVGLKNLWSFLQGHSDYSSVQPFTLSLNDKSPVGSTSKYSYYMGKDKVARRSYSLNFTLPPEAKDVKTVFAIPGAELNKGTVPYYWLDLFSSLPTEEGEQPFSSGRLFPALKEKTDFFKWHSMGEQLLVDYMTSHNNIDFSDLIPFFIKVSRTYHIRSDLNAIISFDKNRLVQPGDTVKFIPNTDPKGRYQWLDGYKVMEENEKSKWPLVKSRRLLSNGSEILLSDWYGYEKQLLLDYVAGVDDISFKDLAPIKTFAPLSRDTLSLVPGLDLYIRPGHEGQPLIVIPKVDSSNRYQWFEVYLFNDKENRIEGECIAEGRLEHKKIVQSKWNGYRVELLKEVTNGTKSYQDLEPINLQIGDNPMINLWKEHKRVYFVPSQKFGLQKGDRVVLVPTSTDGENLVFTLMKEEMNLGVYKFNIRDKTFRLDEIIYQAGDGNKKEEDFISSDDADELMRGLLEE